MKRAVSSASRKKRGAKEVAAYIAALPAPARRVLRRVRSVIHKAVPAAEEVISYSIPAFKLHGRPVLFFAGWQEVADSRKLK